MNNEDMIANLDMYFKQIIALTDLMLENNSEMTPNILTIRDLAQAGLTTINAK